MYLTQEETQALSNFLNSLPGHSPEVSVLAEKMKEILYPVAIAEEVKVEEVKKVAKTKVAVKKTAKKDATKSNIKQKKSK